MKNLTRNEFLQRYKIEEIITYITILKSCSFTGSTPYYSEQVQIKLSVCSNK